MNSESKKNPLDINDLATKIRRHDRRALGRAITLIESSRTDHRQLAHELINELLPDTGKSIRIGISGTPGVGKSTFIEVFGKFLTGLGKKVAVLTVDPSSKRTGGSILGDKTRMEELSRDANAYIRPSPSGGSLGGVARRTREAMLLTEAAGFDVVLVETVGVGQSETTVDDMVDVFLLLLAPAGGDELQGIKRGVMELADLVVINKADGELVPVARRAAAEYKGALGLMRPKHKNWKAEVKQMSALKNIGIEDIWTAIERFEQMLKQDDAFDRQRSEQAAAWMWSELGDNLMNQLNLNPEIKAVLPELERQVKDGKMLPTVAANQLLALFLGK